MSPIAIYITLIKIGRMKRLTYGRMHGLILESVARHQKLQKEDQKEEKRKMKMMRKIVNHSAQRHTIGKKLPTLLET